MTNISSFSQTPNLANGDVLHIRPHETTSPRINTANLSKYEADLDAYFKVCEPSNETIETTLEPYSPKLLNPQDYKYFSTNTAFSFDLPKRSIEDWYNFWGDEKSFPSETECLKEGYIK